MSVMDNIKGWPEYAPEHVAQLKARFDSETVCPKCGQPLVKRTARQGTNASKAFLGCSGFPKCRFVKNV